MSNLLLQEFQRLAGITPQRESSETDYYTPPAPQPQRQRQVEQQEEPVQQRPRRKGISGVRQELEEMRQEMRAGFNRVEERLDGVITEQHEMREQQTGLSKLIYEMRGEIRPSVMPVVTERVVYRDRASSPLRPSPMRPAPVAESAPEKKEVIPRYGLLEID